MDLESPRPSGERLAEIVDAAERAALSVIDDAEQEARRWLDEAQLQADRIVAERLREAADLIEGQRGAERARPGPRPAQRRSGRPRPKRRRPRASHSSSAPDVDRGRRAPRGAGDESLTPAGEARPAAEPELDPLARARGRLDRGRLLATQMAVSGSSRKEIEMRLRNGFEIEDTG